METPTSRGAAWLSWPGALDARLRREPAQHLPEPSAFGATWRDAGALRWLILFQFLVFWACAALSPLLAPDFDVFFHLAHGRYQALHGEIPSEAYFSFLEPRPYLDYYWLFQRLLFTLWDAAGPAGLFVLRALVVSLTLVLLAAFLFGRRRSASGLLSSILVFGLVGVRLVDVLSLSRPFVFSYLFLLAMLFILEARPRWLPLLPAIGIAWINLHGVEYPVMVALLLAYAGDEALAALRRGALTPESRRRFLWLGLTLPTVLLSPHGLALVAFPFNSTALVSLYVGEMRQPEFASFLGASWAGLAEDRYGVAFLLFLLGLAVAARQLQRRELQPVHLVLFAAGVFLALKGSRFTVEFSLLALPLLSRGIFAERRACRPLAATLLVAAISGLLTYAVAEKWVVASRAAYPLAFNQFPYGVASFLEKVAPPGGRVYNTAHHGGFLLWQLGERHKIMMDMEVQAIFRDEDFFLNRVTMIDEKAFAAFVERYRPDFVAVGHDVGRVATALHRSADFVPVAVDDGLVLLVDRRRHPELAAQWGLRALDPWRFKLDGDYRLSPEAAAEAERLYALEPRGLRLSALLAQAELARRDAAAAENYVATVLAIAPESAEGWNLSSRLRLDRGDLEGAARDLEKAILRADPAAAHRLRGPLAFLLAQLGDKKGALEQLERRGTFIEPMPLEELRLQVELLEAVGNPAEAAAARRILELRSGTPLTGE